MILFCGTVLYADDYGTIQGRIVNSNSQPISGASIAVTKTEQDIDKTITSRESGLFQLAGLPAGQYTIYFRADGHKSLLQEKVFLDPSQTLTLKVLLPENGSDLSASCKQIRLDYTNSVFQTILDEAQIHESPSGHNVWFLMENQDHSATSNRIDVGGLWGSTPALFSARGGTSWTQTVYQLNGMDVTDPYITGSPLFYPDFFSLHYTQLINAGNPPESLSPGGIFNLMMREGSNEFHGGFSAFYIHDELQSNNITSALQQEGLMESHRFKQLMDGNFHLSGALIPNKLTFFTSLTASRVSRDIAQYQGDDEADVYSGLVNLKFLTSSGKIRFLWTGQKVSHPSFGAWRQVPFEATLDRNDLYNIFQLTWDANIKSNHLIKAGISYSQGDIRSDLQKDVTFPHGIEIFQNIPVNSSPMASRDKRDNLTFLLKGESLLSSPSQTRHKFQYGFQFQKTTSSSQKEIKDNIHLHFFRDNPLEVVFFNTPVRYKESALHMNLFVQDSVTFSNYFSFYLGFNLAYSQGMVPDSQNPESVLPGFERLQEHESRIGWLNISPRMGLIFPLSRSKTSAIKISAARYYYTLPLSYLTFGNPNAYGGLVYSWNDENFDSLYQEGEQGTLLRKEGPYFSQIDPELQRPYTDELTVSFQSTAESGWSFSFGGFIRRTKNLVETINTGLPFSAYDPIRIFDSGDDRISGTHDDQIYTVFNQKPHTFGQDYFFLTNAEAGSRKTQYYGLDLTLVKRFSDKFTFFLALTATQADGETNPGNQEWENDDGIIGLLYDNPNTQINSQGRVRFDRAYTARLGFNFKAPFGIRLSGVVKYYDGQPFARKIIVENMNQGPFYIQANPRGTSRYEYNMTTEFRVEKTISIRKSRLKLILDGFNLFNRNLATRENEWTVPNYGLRYATEIQSPRVFRLGLAYEF
jgi:hypothetical protein